MGAYNGWERANWFAKPGDDTSEEATHTWERLGPVGAAHPRRMRSRPRRHCGVLPTCLASRGLEGAKAPARATVLDSRIAAVAEARAHDSSLTFPDNRGRILTEMSVMAFTEKTTSCFITAATAQWHDRELSC